MAIWDILRKSRIKNLVDDRSDRDYKAQQIGSIEIPERLTDENAFLLANTVTEIYNPIDFYADRISKLRYYIANKAGEEVPKTELNRFINNIHPFYSFSDIVYQYAFSYLSSGFTAKYVTVPDSYTNITANSITRIDILQPNLLEIFEYSNISPLDLSNLNDAISQIRYSAISGIYKPLDIEKLSIDNIDSTRRESSVILSKSPLFKAIRAINNLLATYSARYNVYVNNGAAGYLVKKPQTNKSMEDVVDPITRQDIVDDINNRQGLTGRRSLWGISSVPIEFINTLIDIQKLMPFEETLEDSIKIASVYQIPPELIPRKDQSTFANKDTAERSVWENGLMSMVQVVCNGLTKDFRLDKIGYQIKADYSTVSVLKANESENEDLIAKRLANLEKMLSIYPDKSAEINKEIDKILMTYGQR